jgi:hypothetical protein
MTLLQRLALWFSPWRGHFLELRRVEAAQAIIRSVRQDIGNSSGSLPAEKWSLIAAQIRMLVDFVRQYQLLGPLPPAGAQGGADEREAILLQLTDSLATSSLAMLSPALEDLDRLLEIRASMWGDVGRWGVHYIEQSAGALAVAGAGSVPPGGSTISPRYGSETFAPSEAALLASLTEKFYGSWAFRFVGIALFASVILAGLGTFILGGQELRLSDGIERAVKNAKSDITDITEAAHDDLDGQRKTLAVALEALDRSRQELADQIERGKTDVQSKIGEFTRDTDRLKTEVISKVVFDLRQQLDKQESGFKDELHAALVKVRDQDVASLKENVSNVAMILHQFNDDLVKDSDDLRQIGPKLDLLRAQAQESAQLAATLKSIKNDQDAIHNAALEVADQVRLVHQQEEAAQKSAADSEQLRSKTIGALQPLAEALATQQKVIAGLQTKLQSTTQSVAEIESGIGQQQAELAKAKQSAVDLAHLDDSLKASDDSLKASEDSNKALASRLAALASRLAALDMQLADLEAHAKKAAESLTVATTPPPAATSAGSNGTTVNGAGATPANTAARTNPAAASSSTAKPPTLTEERLSLDQWKVIQRSLEKQGFDPGDVDGHPGDKTRQAIRSYQAQAGAKQTGHLLPEEIAQLMQGR